MIFWKTACDSDKKLLFAIGRLFRFHPGLLELFFDSKYPKLKEPSKKIKRNSLVLSSGERTLVLIALDIWDGSGNSNFPDIYQNLDERNFKNVLLTLGFLRDIPAIYLCGQLELDIISENRGQLEMDNF